MLNYPDELNTRKAEKAVSFYHKEMPSFILYHNVQEIKLPINENYIIIGINNQKSAQSGILHQYASFAKNMNYTGANTKIFIVSLLKDMNKKTISGVPVCSYESEALGEHFKISDSRNFVILVNSNNEIEFFDYYLVNINEINLLIQGLSK